MEKKMLPAVAAARNLDAAIPLRSAETELQSTKAQRQQRREKVTFKPSVALRAQIEQESTAKRRRPQPSRTRANFSPQRILRLTEETQCVVQILTFKSHPGCSSSNAICQQGLAKQNPNRKTILKNKYPSRSLGAAISLQFADEQEKEKVALNPQLHHARKSNRNRWQSDDARNRREREPTFLRSGTSV